MIGQSAQDILARRAAQAEENRRQMPFTTSKVDENRAAGLDPTVTFAEENGRTVGKPSPKGVVPVLARITDPDTSKDAAERATAFVAKHEAKIFEALYQAGFLGLTAKEIASQTGLSDVQVSRRTGNMGERGLIKRSGEKRGGCCVWTVQ